MSTDKPNLYKRLKTDASAEQNGTPVDFGACVLRIRSMRSQVYRDVEDQIARENRPYFKASRNVPADVQDAQNVRRAVALTVSFVSGVTDEDGNDLPYSRENAVKIMTDLVELRDMVIGAGSLHDTFRAEEIKSVTANLSNASTSSSGTPAAAAQA